MLSDLMASRRGLDKPLTSQAVPKIFVSVRPDAELLVTGDGDPVWPLQDDGDRRAVGDLCGFRSIRIEEVQGRPGEARRAGGVVTGLGCSRTQEIGRLYAHLTGRRFEAAEDVSEVIDLRRSEVVVTTFEHLTSELLYRLYANPGEGSCPGLICAASLEALRRQALVRSILSRPEVGPEPASWTAVYPTAQADMPSESHYRVFTANSAPHDVRAALTSRSGVLTIATHCDGVDAFMGRGLTLCAIDQGGPSGDGVRAPSCRLSGYCHRHGRSIEDFRALGVSIAPAELSAGVLLLDTCFGTLAADAPIDPAWGLGRHFIENLGIGAIATTWELTLLDTRKVDELIGDLRAGLTLGRAVARFNRSLRAQRTAARLAVFGDPETRVTGGRPSSSIVRPDAFQEPTTPPAETESLELRELAFSRAYLELGVAALEPQVAASSPLRIDQIRTQLDTAKDALGRLKRYELAQWLAARPRTADDETSAAQLRQALILDAYVRRPTDDWIQFAWSTAWNDGRCEVCGAPAKVGVLTLRIPGVSRRRVVMCPRGGLTEDMPDHVRITLRFDPSSRSCTVAGTLPERDWSAALIVRTRIEANNRMWTWPAQPDGRPQPGMQLPEALPAGPLKLAWILIHGGSLAWSAHDMHASEADPPQPARTAIDGDNHFAHEPGSVQDS